MGKMHLVCLGFRIGRLHSPFRADFWRLIRTNLSKFFSLYIEREISITDGVMADHFHLFASMSNVTQPRSEGPTFKHSQP